jgi:hypothetical protein
VQVEHDGRDIVNFERGMQMDAERQTEHRPLIAAGGWEDCVADDSATALWDKRRLKFSQ